MGQTVLRRSVVGSLGKGEGGIVGRGEEKVAAYREAEDQLYTFSPVCPHMGCEAFNKAERTWACRCHGSRLERDGRVSTARPRDR